MIAYGKRIVFILNYWNELEENKAIKRVVFAGLDTIKLRFDKSWIMHRVRSIYCSCDLIRVHLTTKSLCMHNWVHSTTKMHHQQTITIINRKCHLAAHVPISKLVFIRKAHIQTHAHVYVHIYILSLPTSNIHAFMAFQQSKSRETSKYRKKTTNPFQYGSQQISAILFIASFTTFSQLYTQRMLFFEIN